MKLTVEPRDGNEGNRLGVEPNLLDEVGGFLDDFLETILRPFGGVHLVYGDDELLNTKSVCKQSVLAGLTILGDTSLELTSLILEVLSNEPEKSSLWGRTYTGSNDKNGAISLGSTSDHVLDEITMTGGI